MAFRPFEKLNLVLQHPAHLATFLHYLISNAGSEEELFLLLKIDRFVRPLFLLIVGSLLVVFFCGSLEWSLTTEISSAFANESSAISTIRRWSWLARFTTTFSMPLLR